MNKIQPNRKVVRVECHVDVFTVICFVMVALSIGAAYAFVLHWGPR